jgi:hypothetical protein
VTKLIIPLAKEPTNTASRDNVAPEIAKSIPSVERQITATLTLTCVDLATTTLITALILTPAS